MTRKTLGWIHLQYGKYKKFSFVLNISILFLMNLSVNAQNNIVRGKITNSVGRPLQGVSVIVQGSKTGTSSNASGEFQLNGVPERSALVISFVGLATQELRLTPGQRSVNVVMREEVGNLQDVVVTGFQRIEKKRFTGAAVTLRAEDVKMEGVTDVSRMLEGRAAGVSVQNVSGTFGAHPK